MLPRLFPLLLLCLLSIGAWADLPLPPKRIFHFGEKPLLLQDDLADTIPQEAWDRFIMGEKTRYGLSPFRRGLYGSANFDEVEFYGNLYIGTPKIPWVMAITLKDECRKPETIASFDSHKDPRFQPWLVSRRAELDRDFPGCVVEDKTEGIFVRFLVIAYGAQDECDPIGGLYLKEMGARIVVDDAWENSWYIRDRSCIEHIDAAPTEVLEVLANARFDQKSRASTHSPSPAYGAATVAVLTGALADATSADDQALDRVLGRVREKAAGSDIALSFVAPDPKSNPLWVRETAPAVIDAYRRCRTAGDRERFKQIADSFGRDLQQDAGRQDFARVVRAFTSALAAVCR